MRKRIMSLLFIFIMFASFIMPTYADIVYDLNIGGDEEMDRIIRSNIPYFMAQNPGTKVHYNGEQCPEQFHSYNIVKHVSDTTNLYDAFWCRANLPTLTPSWIPYTINQVNFEFWYWYQGNKFVEMGYHNGFGINDDITTMYVDYKSSYSGCFAAQYDPDNTSMPWRLIALPNPDWKPGETHTMGVNLYKDILGNDLCDMRTDNTTVRSFQNVIPGLRVDAGIEWVVSNPWDSNEQNVSLPAYITDLNLRKNGVFYPWSSTGYDIKETNTHSNVRAYYDKTNNKACYVRIP